jgi:hypothetical protein
LAELADQAMRKVWIFLFGLWIGRAGADVVAHPDVPCNPGEIRIWTAAMQLAADRIVGSKSGRALERVSPPNPNLDAVAKFQWDETAVLPETGWFVEAGPATEALAARATEKWRALAGPKAPAFKITGSGEAAFAGIKRDFSFRQAFAITSSLKLPWSDGKVPVSFFGTRGDRSGKHEEVRVLMYRPAERSYALQFPAQNGDDTLVLYLPAHASTMKAAMDDVRKWRSEWPKETGGPNAQDPRLHAKDDLRVPVVDLTFEGDLMTRFAGSIYFKGESVPWRIVQAKSSMQLNVDEKGVKFTATATMEAEPFSVAPKKVVPHPRWFWFDRPFFLFLWRDGAEWPYAGVWFGTADHFAK